MKNRIVNLLLLLAAMLFAGGAPPTARAATVHYDYDREQDFSHWQYAAWAGAVDADVSIAERRLARAIEAGFTGRGYTLVAEPAKADFLVSYQAMAWRDVYVEARYDGPAFGRSARLERDPRGALVIQVVDRRTGRIAWHGVVADDLASDPKQADKRTAKAVAKLLKNFPARGGAR